MKKNNEHISSYNGGTPVNEYTDNQNPGDDGNSGDNDDSNSTELDKKYAKIISAFENNKKSINDFATSPKYSQEEWTKDRDRVYEKEAGMDDSGGEYGALDDDKALEAILYFMGNHDQIFNQEMYSEPGSDFDDYFNGADVVFGLKSNKPGEYDTVFSVDACSATLKEKVIKKFDNIEYHSFDNTPGCNRLKYYKHGKKVLRLNSTPNYVVGASPKAISEAVDKFEIDPGNSITNELDPDFRKKILLELVLQSKTGIIACNLVENKDEHTRKAFKSHRAVNSACTDALYGIYGIDKKSENSTVELAKKMSIDLIKLRKEDDVFSTIYEEANRRLTQAMRLRDGRKVNKVNGKVKFA